MGGGKGGIGGRETVSLDAGVEGVRGYIFTKIMKNSVHTKICLTVLSTTYSIFKYLCLIANVHCTTYTYLYLLCISIGGLDQYMDAWYQWLGIYPQCIIVIPYTRPSSIGSTIVEIGYRIYTCTSTYYFQFNDSDRSIIKVIQYVT